MGVWVFPNLSAICMDDILRAKGLERYDLDYVVNPSELTRIAERVGADWKSCAFFLGMLQDDIDDITEENIKVRNRRIAMLHRWSQLKGNEATYLNLIESFVEMGRRDLIEFVLNIMPSRKPVYDISPDVMDEATRKVRHRVSRVLSSTLQTGECKTGIQFSIYSHRSGKFVIKLRFMS